MMHYNPELNYPIPVDPSWNIIDPSKTKTFMSCPRKFFFEYVLGWRPETPSNHLIFGSAWHKAMEVLYLNGMKRDSIIDAFDAFLAYYRQHIDPGDDDLYWPKTPERALKALVYYAGIHSDYMADKEIVVHDGKPLVEIGGTVSVTSSLSMAFRQDLILRGPRGIFALDHKTGSSPYGWDSQWELDVQTAIYTHVLYCMFDPLEVAGITFSGTFFKKTKDDPKPTAGRYTNKDEKDPFRHFDFKRVPVYKSIDNLSGMLAMILHYLDMIRIEFDNLAQCKDSDKILTAFPQNWDSCNNYGGCEYHDFCTTWNNPLRHCDKLPLGIKIEFWNPLAEPVNVEVNV